MNKKAIYLFFIIIIIFSLLLAGCSRNAETPEPVDNQTVTEAPLTTGQGDVTEDQGEEPVVTSSSPSGVPEDVPIPPDAYEIQVPNSLNISFKVNLPIADVVAFYKEEFPNYGWDVINNPDSVVGSMAQLSRSNAAGDRLIFSIQYNPVGEFTVVQIFITR